MLAMLLSIVIVIYTRFSSDLQSAKSCKDQEREVRDALTRMGIDHSNAIVINDEAESGTTVFRDGFQRLEAMVLAKEISILAVDDQSRLSRADNTFAFITDLVYADGRFISTGEGIDTEQAGWELRVKVMELHNSTTIRELGRRVRRGQLGRVLSQLSAGDFCYGYESFFVNPDAARNHRGPKPERALRIKESHAEWVRKVFEWFNAGRSISWIARELTRLNAPIGNRRRRHRWRHSHVRQMLANEKYIGRWRWGTTRTMRNSKGKKKQVPVPENLQVVVDRPELRIIDDKTWETARDGLRRLEELYGKKPGQKHRGPKVHHTALYPSGLLAGLLFCSKCDTRLWQESSGKRLYFGCPHRGHQQGACELTTRAPAAKAEEVILGFLAQVLTSWPEWLEKALTAMRQRIEEFACRVPEEVARDERRLRDLESQIENLVDALADGGLQSQAVRNRLDEAEREAEQLRKRIENAQKLLSAPVEMPDDAWVRRQLADLASIIREGDYQAALLLRKMFGKILADQVIPPGKTRGYARLRFRVNGWETLRAIVADKVSSGTLDMLLPASGGVAAMSDEIVLDLGGPTAMDRWAPKIAEMRSHGVKWTEIVEITGLDLNRAYRAWKRYVDAAETAADDREDDDTGEHDLPEESSDETDTAGDAA